MRKAILVIIAFIAVSLVFFYPIFKGKVPFPGDLLVGEYAPYNSYNFLGYAPGGYPNKGQDFDVITLLYPEKEFSIRAYKNFELPLWNPYNFSGNPHLASLQSGSLYPLNILFFILPYLTAWTIFILLQPIMAGIFSYLFAREIKLSVKSSFFSALVFAFSSYLVVWMEYGNIGHSIVWLPLLLWISLKNLNKLTVLKSILITLVLAFSIFAGHIQVSFYVFAFLFGFIIFHVFFVDRSNKLKKLSVFGLIFILSSALSAVQLLPMVELFSQSARGSYPHLTFLSLLIPLFHIITMLVPDFFGNPATRNYWLTGTYIERVTYIGVIPLIFIVYSFFKKQNSMFWFFAISATTILLISFNTYLAQLVYYFQIPIITTAVPTRIIFLFCFSASIVAGFGMNSLEKEPDRKKYLKTTFILGSIYALAWIFALVAPLISKSPWTGYLSISKRNLLLPSAIFIAGAGALFFSFYKTEYRRKIIILLIALSMADLFYFFHKITPFAPRETVYPDTELFSELKSIQGIDRSWGYGSGHIPPNLQTYEKLFSVDGYNALHIKRYGEILSSGRDGKIANPVPRSDPALASGYGGSDLRENKYRQRLLDLLGVKYLLNKVDPMFSTAKADSQTFDETIYKLKWQGAPWQIYENKEVLPRIFLASDYVVEKDKDKIIKLIFDKNFDLRNKLILEEEITPEMNFAEDKNAKVQIRKYSPNEIVLETESKTNMLLFISDNYYQGWRVSVDKEFGKIYRADYSFRAVPVVGGKHEVRFWYSPDSFMLGLGISAISFLGMLLAPIIFKMRGKSNVEK